MPCTTSVLDHLDTVGLLRLLARYLLSLSQVDFAVNYTRVTFDGTLGGEEDEYERNMMGSCYQVIREETVEHEINHGPQHLIMKIYFMTQCPKFLKGAIEWSTVWRNPLVGGQP